MITWPRGRIRGEEKCPLKTPHSPATLRHFASTRLALDLCNFKRLQDCSKEQFNCENVLQVALPTSIKIVINKRIESVDRKLKHIYHHFNKLLVKYNDVDAHAIYFDSVRYGPDGNISFEHTAKKLLSNDKLSQLDKYGIACVYCFEDDIRRIWPTLAGLTRIHAAFAFDLDRILVKYWSIRMGKFKRALPSYDHMAACVKMGCDYWPAFKYIMNKIPTDEQFQLISYVLRKDRFKNAKHILPKLNRIQLNYALRFHCGDIIIQLITKEKRVDFILQIWNEGKDIVTDEQFLHLLRALCNKSYKCSNKIGCNKLAYIRLTLYEIWISSARWLKRDFLNVGGNVAEMLKDLEDFDRENKLECYDHDMSFFLQMFQDMPFEMRNSLWLRYWLVFAVRYRAKFLNNFLELCMKKENMPLFKETVMLDYNTIGSFLEFLFKWQFYEDVMDYLKMCTSNRNLIGELGKQMIQSSNGLQYNSELRKFSELSKFIDDCFGNIEEIVNFKAQFYFAQQFQNLLINRMKYGLTNDLIRINELFLYSESDVVYAKRNLLEYWQRYYLSSGKIDFNCCKEFLLWCIGDSNTLSGSNPNFPVDEVFNLLLLNAVPKLSLLLGPLEMSRSEPDPISSRQLDEFTTVDEFLMWYFVNPEAIRDYKLNKIWYRDLPAIKSVLSMRNESVMNDVLSWFFEGDLVEVKYFKYDLKKN